VGQVLSTSPVRRPALAEVAENFVGRKTGVPLDFPRGDLVTTPFIMPRMARNLFVTYEETRLGSQLSDFVVPRSHQFIRCSRL
jgi:hypothetical protein